MKRTLSKSKEQLLFEKIDRTIRDFKEFSALYKACEVDHFDLCIYSQNFTIILHEIKKRLNNPIFCGKSSLEVVDALICHFNYFVQAYNIVEELRSNISIVKIHVNEFMFSEN